MNSAPIPLHFYPHPLIRGGHLQTMAGVYWPSSTVLGADEVHLVTVSDGDQIALHENGRRDWRSGEPVALLLHGLAGCHASGYMVRTAARLVNRNLRTFRMDSRGSGATVGRARHPGHAGRWEDAVAALRLVATLCPDSPITLIGFSMGGNIVLRVVAERENAADPSVRSCLTNVQRAIAISPPVDLQRCCEVLQTGVRRIYDRYLVGLLNRTWQTMGGPSPRRRPRSIYEFDQLVTAPQSGFASAEEYYAMASSLPHLCKIKVPTKILAALDDPMVPTASLLLSQRSSATSLFITESGGHLGYLTQRRHVTDCRWMDQQIEAWATE